MKLGYGIIIIFKKERSVYMLDNNKPLCQYCNNELICVDKYDIYYCQQCKKYYNRDLVLKPHLSLELKTPLYKSRTFITWIISVAIIIVYNLYIIINNNYFDWKLLCYTLLLSFAPTYLVWQIKMPKEKRDYYNKINERLKQQIIEVKDNQTVELDQSICPSCKKLISNKAEKCPHCGYVTGVHVCPKCGSIDTKIISNANKVMSVLTIGLFAANNIVKTYKCQKCGTKF